MKVNKLIQELSKFDPDCDVERPGQEGSDEMDLEPVEEVYLDPHPLPGKKVVLLL